MTLSETTQELQSFIKTYPDPEVIPTEQLPSQYQKLVDTIIDHNYLYYVDAKPIISDGEYDQLFAYLRLMEELFPYLISSTSPTQALFGQLADGFQKAEHVVPLLSLENSYNAEDLKDRAARIARIGEKKGNLKWIYRLEPKFDGLSVEFVYNQGRFVQAITRGDGKVGEDITVNVKMIANVPKSIPHLGKLHVRGEIMMPKSQFLKINIEREMNGETPFANTRNAAAGSIKLLDSGEVAKRGLIAVVYEQLLGERVDFQSLGFPMVHLPQKYEYSTMIEEVIAHCQDFQLKKFLEEQDMDFDGLVVKVCDLPQSQEEKSEDVALFMTEKGEHSVFSVRELLGATEHHPRRAIAYKFPAQQVASRIVSVQFQVGRTGIITPVANIEPVQLSGATIARVSLHNFDFIQKKQIKQGDFVRVQRSGEVIPYIVGVIKERRMGTEEPIIPPLFCPVCGGPITNIDIHYYCSNPACPAQIKEKILHFVSRDAMDIGGIGEAMVDLLVDQNILTSVADLYRLTTLQNQMLLRRFPSIGEKKVAEIVEQLELSKQQPLWRVLNALGIPNVGKKIAQDLAEHLAEQQVGNLEELIQAFSREEIQDLYGIGEKIWQGIQVFITTPETIHLLKDLEESGVSFASSAQNDGVLEEKGSFSLTGTFPLARKELIEQMKKAGYRYDEQLTSKTGIMLVGNKPSSKLAKAKQYGSRIMDDWLQIVQEFGLQATTVTSKKNQLIQGGLF